jgi:hypothetical protein
VTPASKPVFWQQWQLSFPLVSAFQTEPNCGGQLRIFSSYLKGDDSAHAVSNENGLLDLEFSTEPCEVIGELHHRVFLQRGIAGAVSKEIRGFDAVVLAEVIDLW